jgi:hypothetical protein
MELIGTKAAGYKLDDCSVTGQRTSVPSYTAMATPHTSTSRDSHSALLGSLRSMTTDPSAVNTGMQARMTCGPSRAAADSTPLCGVRGPRHDGHGMGVWEGCCSVQLQTRSRAGAGRTGRG